MRKKMMIRVVAPLLVVVLPMLAAGGESINLKYALALYTDQKGTGLNLPQGVACNENRVVVADSDNDRLIVYSLDGGDPKGGAEIKVPQLRYPTRVKITSKGDYLVLNERQTKLLLFSKEGVFKQHLEPSEVPGNSMIVPVGIDVDSADNIYLLDIAGGRVLFFDPEVKFKRQITFPGDYGFFSDIAVDPKGTVFIIDSVKGAVYSTGKDPAAFTPIANTIKDDVKFAGSIAVDNKGVLYISDKNSGGIVVVGPDGAVRNRLLSLGWKEGTVRYPGQMCLQQNGDVYIADTANSRVQKFTSVK